MNRLARETDRELVEMGFRLVRQKRKLVYHHDAGGRQLTAPATPSDRRSKANVIADARRLVRELA